MPAPRRKTNVVESSTQLGRPMRLVLMTVIAVLVATPIASLRATPARASCGFTYCGDVIVKPFSLGTGNGHVVTDPPGIDCHETAGGALSGTCVHTFGWDGSSSIYVDLGIEAAGDSYACYLGTCTGIGGTIGTSIVLAANDVYDLLPSFTLGSVTHVSVAADPSTGSGRMTSSPAGIDCRVVAGVKSGSCAHDFWYIGSGLPATFTTTPDTGSFACLGIICGPLGGVFTSQTTLHPGDRAETVAFWLPVPITVKVTGSGKVVSSPAGISCPSTCAKWFQVGQTVTLTATPAAGWIIQDWGGVCDLVSPSSNQCSVSNSVKGVTASIVFQSLATPAPSPPPTGTPRPVTTPRPATTPGPSTSSTTAPGSPAAPGPSSNSAPSARPTTDGEATAGASQVAAGGEQQTVSPASGSPIAGNPNDALEQSSASDDGGLTLVIVIAVVVALLALALGLVLGRRSRLRPR